MIAIYGFCAVVGGVLAAIMLLGGDADADLSGGLDVDAGGLGGGDTNGSATATGGVLSSLPSFRTIVFALAFFGVTGLVLPLVGTGQTVTFVAALGAGGFAGLLNDRIIRYVTRTSGGVGLSELAVSGTPGRVTVPVGANRRGRVSIQIEGRTVALAAEPYRPGSDTFDVGATVVVVEVHEGVAKIAPLDI
jgi:membrane protein implicated in regulation of membrane protease activity